MKIFYNFIMTEVILIKRNIALLTLIIFSILFTGCGASINYADEGIISETTKNIISTTKTTIDAAVIESKTTEPGTTVKQVTEITTTEPEITTAAEITVAETTVIKTTEKIIKMPSYGDVIIFDDLEIVFGNDISWSKLSNQFSDKNDMDVFFIPIEIKNIKNETHSLNQFYYKQYGSKGTQLDSVGYYFDGEVSLSGNMRSGATIKSFMAFLYDGDGDYYVEFNTFLGKPLEVKLSVKQGENPAMPIEKTTEHQTTTVTENITSGMLTYGDKIIFDDLEIIFKDDITWKKVNNRFSDNNGADVFLIPISVKNIKNESHSLNMFYYKQYGTYGTQLDSISTFFDGDIAFSGDMRTGAVKESFMAFLYDGDGDYYVEFTKFWDDPLEVKLPIKK